MAIADMFRKKEQPQGGIAGDVTGKPAGNRIGDAALIKATETLRRYKAGKRSQEQRVIENERWWKLRHWEVMEEAGRPSGNENDARPVSAWLFNVLMGKQADAIEAYPESGILPREEGDKAESKLLTSILPVILDQNEFDEIYSANAWKKNKSGTAVYGIFWDRSKLNGLGDISIKSVDVLNLFWEPGVADIQDSRNVFHAELYDNETLEEAYPQLKGKLKGSGGITLSEYLYDDDLKSVDKSLVVDWYYKRTTSGKTVLHYCKYVGSNLLYASENDPELAERGWYDDGKYPFVFDRLFPVEGTICGLGYIDIGKSPQESIDLIGQQILKNIAVGASPRWFVRKDSGINEIEFLDFTKPFVHTVGNLGEEDIRQINFNPLPNNIFEILQSKVEELKYTCANMDIVNGAGMSGVTAASAIAALQETAGRSSKSSTLGSYRAYKKLVKMVIERIRQFYELPRQFRIVGERGMERYVNYTNAGLQAQSQGNDFGVDMGYRLPEFDVEVIAQKKTPYSRLSQNELAIQLFGLGAFNPQMADQMLMMMDMMEFPGKDELMQKIQQQSSLYKQLLMFQELALTLAAKYEPENAQRIMQGIQGGQPVAPGQAGPMQPQAPAFPTGEPPEAKHVQQAREKADQAGQPSGY